MKKYMSYDAENDIFALHKGFSSDEKFKGNAEAGDVILDISTKGRIRGVEIVNAQDFFSDFIDKNSMNNITDANFSYAARAGGILLTIMLKQKNSDKDVPVKVAVPVKSW